MKMKKECIAMLLAGGRGSRLGVLTKDVAKPAVPFGGKYRIIDFPLSNCVNSGIDTVGVLTQYMPLDLNSYIGNGQPWDLDRNFGGVSILPPYESGKQGECTRVRQTRSIRISTLSRIMIPNMLLYFPETISTRWTTARCSSIIRNIRLHVPSRS